MIYFAFCIYHLSTWSNFSFLHYFRWITFSTQSCLLLYFFCASLYSFCASLLYSLIMQISEEYSRHQMTKTHSRHRSFNSGFSLQHLHHLDVITASLGWSCCPHERSPPPEETDYGELSQSMCSQGGQKNTLQRPTKGFHEIFRYHPQLPRISGAEQIQVAWSCQTWSESLWNQKKRSDWAAQET